RPNTGRAPKEKRAPGLIRPRPPPLWKPPPPPKCPPPPNPPWPPPPPPPPRAHPAGVRTTNVMPTKLSNVYFLLFQYRYSYVLLPLRVGGILRCPARVGAISLFRDPLKVAAVIRSEEHTSELQSPCNLVCRLLLEK